MSARGARIDIGGIGALAATPSAVPAMRVGRR